MTTASVDRSNKIEHKCNAQSGRTAEQSGVLIVFMRTEMSPGIKCASKQLIVVLNWGEF